MGGDLMFFDGVYGKSKTVGEFVHWKQFCHGRLISGEFNKIYYRSSIWSGERTVVVFYTSQKILTHFQHYGIFYYSRYQMKEHPSFF